MSISILIAKIVADNDPRNGDIATRIIRMVEDDDRQPDTDGIYHDDYRERVQRMREDRMRA
jgi:hypothetical protein